MFHMRFFRLCLFLSIVINELSFAVSQSAMKEDQNIESISLKSFKKEVNNEDLNRKLEEMVELIEENRLHSWNLLKNTIAGLKKELITEMNLSIEGLKMELTEKMDTSIEGLKVELTRKIDTSSFKTKTDIVEESEKLTSEINKVNMEVDNVKLNVTSEGKIISIELNELKRQFKEQSDIDRNNIVTELKQINNNTNMKCENRNEFGEFKELMMKLVNPAANCAELLLRGERSGIRKVFPFKESPSISVEVVCDQDTDGGGWTVLQNRDDLPIRENFQRTWSEYSYGFGHLIGEFWLGLEYVHVMTKDISNEIRFDLEDNKGVKKSAIYKSFSIGSAQQKYSLHIGTYSGNAGEALSYHNLLQFTTFDQDNDSLKDGNCAQIRKGAWWYGQCGYASLNGQPFIGKYSNSLPNSNHGIQWYHFGGDNNSLRKTKMMFRPQRKADFGAS